MCHIWDPPQPVFWRCNFSRNHHFSVSQLPQIAKDSIHYVNPIHFFGDQSNGKTARTIRPSHRGEWPLLRSSPTFRPWTSHHWIVVRGTQYRYAPLKAVGDSGPQPDGKNSRVGCDLNGTANNNNNNNNSLSFLNVNIIEECSRMWRSSICTILQYIAYTNGYL